MSKFDTPHQREWKAARECFSGRGMTENQFAEAFAITAIIRDEIKRSGSFIEKLTDYGHAFARNQRFDSMRGEKILRDIYQARNGESMNQTREALLATEERLPDDARSLAFKAAEVTLVDVQEGTTRPLYLAMDHHSTLLADVLEITQNAAKALMSEEYENATGQDFYAEGKELEEAYHKPVREAEIAARKAEQLQSRSQSRSYS